LSFFYLARDLRLFTWLALWSFSPTFFLLINFADSPFLSIKDLGWKFPPSIAASSPVLNWLLANGLELEKGVFSDLYDYFKYVKMMKAYQSRGLDGVQREKVFGTNLVEFCDRFLILLEAGAEYTEEVTHCTP
jgi:hypothetical protein